VTVTIGLCEDDDELRGVIRSALEREGHRVRATASGADALRMFTESPPEVLILDIGLPDADGRDVCMALRANGVSCPVLFLTARSSVPDRISGFHSGGDDYLAKPFALAELLVRVAALARRAPAGPPGPNDLGVTLDPAAHALRHGERRVALTPTEFRLMAALVARPDEVMRRAALIATAWPDGAIVHQNTLDAYMARLRRKLREVGAEVSVETVRGVGYALR
jgi:two-component system, OmpR family, response regulator